MSKFWDLIETLGDYGVWMNEHPEPPQVARARELLLQELPEAAQWLKWDEDDPCPLIFDLMVALAWYAGEDPSPKPMMYDPKDVTFPSSEEDFERVLFQKPPRGAITFLWDAVEIGGFQYPPHGGERLVTFLRNLEFLRDEDGCARLYDGAALGFIRGKKVELFAFPKNWAEIVERVHHEVRRMTAAEKAAKTMPTELQSFVDLLGLDKVREALEALKPV